MKESDITQAQKHGVEMRAPSLTLCLINANLSRDCELHPALQTAGLRKSQARMWRMTSCFASALNGFKVGLSICKLLLKQIRQILWKCNMWGGIAVECRQDLWWSLTKVTLSSFWFIYLFFVVPNLCFVGGVSAKKKTTNKKQRAQDVSWPDIVHDKGPESWNPQHSCKTAETPNPCLFLTPWASCLETW